MIQNVKGKGRRTEEPDKGIKQGFVINYYLPKQQHQAQMDLKKPIKKRQYSRNGCKECKRRKLKCDETKPDCWQCSHLNKTCEYIKSIKFSDSRILKSGTIKSNPIKGKIQIIDFNQKLMQNDSPEQTNESPIRHNTITTSHNNNTSNNNIDDNIGITKNLITEASTLANDIIESIDPQLDHDFILDFDFVKKQNVIESFGLQSPHKQRLEYFYDKISQLLMPFQQTLFNEILLYHAKTSPYLLAAMLSLSCDDDIQQKEKYITTCLKNLNTVFQDQSKILDNIEPLILTVLLLATDPTSTNWKIHLRGAKDLFLKYIKFNTSPSILLAKSWFAAIEILAGLQSFGTGKIHELDELLDVGLYGENSDFAIEIGLLLNNGYNLFLGYSSEAIVMYREFFKLQLNSNDLLFQMSLIHSAKEFQVISDEIVIEEDNPLHPNNTSDLPTSCYGFKDDLVYSWFDLTHQLHVDALLLKIYIEVIKIDETNELVKNLVKQMFQVCFFFDASCEIIDPNDSRLPLVQGPLLALGYSCIDPDDKLKIRNYFQSLMGLGTKSSSVFYKRIENYWDGKVDEPMDLVPFI